MIIIIIIIIIIITITFKIIVTENSLVRHSQDSKEAVGQLKEKK